MKTLVSAAAIAAFAGAAMAAERIEFMFPAPLPGKLARETQKMMKE
ncbi:MAG: hypothetical protein AAGC57_13725 [Pseudomonadota bacterium]